MKLLVVAFTVCALLLGSSVSAAESSNAQAELARIEAQLAKNPGDVDLQVNRGIVLGELRRYEDEIAQANKLIANKVSLRKAYLMQEHGYAGLEKFDRALQSLEMAFNYEKPSTAELLLNIDLLIENGKYKDGLKLASDLIGREPRNAEAYVCRADCYFHIFGPCQQAIKDLEVSLALNPSRESTNSLLTEMRRRLSLKNKVSP